MALTKDTKYPKAYSADGLGDVKPKILIGGKTEKFVPNVNISFALGSSKEQFFLNINRASVTVDKETSSLASEKLALTIGNETDIWHIDENGHLKWDIKFAQKPPTNKFSWALTHTEGLEFYYQPALTQDEIDNGAVRPDNVVGSYAVYCNKSGHYKDADGKTIVNYRAGKLLHIYRPLCIDAKGTKEWAELLIEKGTLTVTIPQKYLDSAAYPVTLDPNLGYDSIGATNFTDYDYYVASHDTTDASGGTISDIYKYWSGVTGLGRHDHVAVYSDGGSNQPSTRLAAQGQIDGTGSAGWKSVSWSASLSASTKYWIVWCPGGAYNAGTVYDTEDTNRTAYGANGGVYDLPDTWDEVGNLSRRYSIYAVYEAGGASSTASIDALLQRSGVTKTASIDALLQHSGVTGTTDLDALLQKARTAKFAIDALLQSAKTGNISLDSLLQAAGITKTAVLDALLQTSSTAPVSLDSLLQAAKTGSLSMDALLQSLKTTTVSMDAILASIAANTVTSALDALLQGAKTGVVSLDALLQGAKTGVVSLDSLLQAAGITKTAGLDALLQTSGMMTVSLDSLLQAAKTIGISINALLQTGQTKTASMDAILAATGSGMVSAMMDGLLQAAKSQGTSVDAMLRSGKTAAVLMDAALQATKTGTASLNGLLQAIKTGTVSVDALLQTSGMVTVSLGALLQQAKTGAVTMDAVLTLAAGANVSVDALLQKALSRLVSLDVLLQSAKSGATSIDAVLSVSALVEMTASLDAILAFFGASAISVDAILLDLDDIIAHDTIRAQARHTTITGLYRKMTITGGQ